ncbi:MAG TPA: hypothetical protein VFF78_05500 [Anaerolineaceae bacterium]|nr:hypothetical protein [Anaerolineaceae bacterium]
MIWSELISLLVYLGFAGTMGTLLRQGRSGLGIAFAGLVFLPVSVGLPENWWMRIAGWLLAVLVIWIFNKCPQRMPDWLWGRTFALAYLITLMFLISAWGMMSGYLGLGAASGITGVLATYRLGSHESH